MGLLLSFENFFIPSLKEEEGEGGRGEEKEEEKVEEEKKEEEGKEEEEEKCKMKAEANTANIFFIWVIGKNGFFVSYTYIYFKYLIIKK